MKAKKHRFTHPDPEKNLPKEKPKTNPSKINNHENNHVYHDFKISITTIAIFATIIVIFYVLNDNLNLINRAQEYLKNFL
ncbi:MAG: hypothetical protein PHT36_00105 [Patescibacteria group bacterium]|nr:hypothetical protein [Patescibacteria group bacterium]